MIKRQCKLRILVKNVDAKLKYESSSDIQAKYFSLAKEKYCEIFAVIDCALFFYS